MISDERLGEIVDFAESFGRHPKLDECASMAKELMAYREAFSEPYAYEVRGVLCHSIDEANIFARDIGDSEPLFMRPVTIL